MEAYCLTGLVEFQAGPVMGVGVSAEHFRPGPS
jgi:hypothetical protein